MQTPRPRVLVVEDEESVQALICEALRLADFECVTARSGYEAIDALRDLGIDLVVLDLSMPGMDGHEVLAKIRSAFDFRPVLVVTARQEGTDLANSFALGADDYLRKPFSIEELAWRCKALLRRNEQHSTPSILRHGAIQMDCGSHRVYVANVLVELSATEFRLLEFLMNNPGRVLLRQQILQRVWGFSDDLESSVLDTYISYLRKKLAPLDAIRTIRGVGYELKALT